MSSPMSIRSNPRDKMLGKPSDDNVGSLDVGWLLHSKKDASHRSNIAPPSNLSTDKPPPTSSQAETTSSKTPATGSEAHLIPAASNKSNINEQVTAPNGNLANGEPETQTAPTSSDAPSGTVAATVPEPTSSNSQGQKHHLKRPHLLGRTSQQDENKSPPQASPKANVSPRQPPRRSSWISSLSSKFSSSSGASSPTRTSNAENPAYLTNHSSAAIPVNFVNPFGASQNGVAAKNEQKQEDKPTPAPVHSPRRPSVLVQAGKERDDHPGFLQSALRKLSSSGSVSLGKGAGSGQTCQRKVMNVDPNRERVKIPDLDPSKLKRVAFCVDVEVAGYASWHEVEEYEIQQKEEKAADFPTARPQSLSMLERQTQTSKNKKDKKEAKKEGKKDVKEAIHKDKAEGAALKNLEAAEAQKEMKEDGAQITAKSTDLQSHPPVSTATSDSPSTVEKAPEVSSSEPQPIPGAKKREKKKRSEAERKERKEKKRRQAEANGQIPIELTGCNDDDDDESSTSPSPPGATTPNITSSPTTDPLRIYKRCAQLRETTIVKKICDQISSPSSTLAEAPGTVAILDLSGTVMTLLELVTLGDWLAVVPVRKLLLEDCQLTDEGVRVVLSALLGCKTPEQAKQNRKLPKRGSGQKGEEQVGVIEKVSLKGNSKLTKVGWKHIALFLHMSKSLKAIDLSGIPFPEQSTSGDFSRTNTLHTTASNLTSSSSSGDGSLGSLLSKALAERFGGSKLEELIMSNCSLSTTTIAHIIDACLKCKLRRLGLAENNITAEGLGHVVRYLESGVCEGLDLGDNDLHDCVEPLSDSLTAENNFFALSLSGCGLAPSDLQVLLPSFVRLKNFRFVDLSNNKRLFSTQPNAVSVLRKYLPQMTSLKRIHLNNVALSSEHAIALAEILPECPSLAHLSILDNSPITELIHSKNNAAQEEACALFASLMAAVRVSHTIIAIDIEVPSADSNEIVKALASQVIAYTLKNMELGALKELEGTPHSKGEPDKDAPEILLHIVGHMEGYEENHDEDEPAPDDDYLMGGNAIVKALGVCLGTADDKSRAASRNISPVRAPSRSGTATPRLSAIGLKPVTHKKPRDVSKQLLESARKIRMRLKPALIREDRAGNDFNYRRLQFLDSTLQRMIQRFEDEYPECKLPASLPEPTMSDPLNVELDSRNSSYADASLLSVSSETNGGLHHAVTTDQSFSDTDEPLALKLSRNPSNTSLASKALTHEEGRMHRYGQSVRREIALAQNNSTNTNTDSTYPTTTPSDGDTATRETEASRLRALEERISNMRGEEVARFRRQCNHDGVEKALRDLGVTAQELLELERSDPEAFERFRESQIAARINAGIE